MERSRLVTMATGPTLHARALGEELARLREAKKIKQRDAADHAEISQSKLSQIESGQGPVRKSGQPPLSKGELHLLGALYGAPKRTMDRLEELRLGAGKLGWWHVYDLPEPLNKYVGLEAGAKFIKDADLILIPGLLQAEEYARKLHHLRGRYSPHEVDQRVNARMERQKRLTGRDALELSVVLDEASVRRCARDPDIARPQLLKLHELAQRPNIDIHVLEFDAGLHPGMSGAFSVLRFPEGVLRDIAYQEYVAGGHIIDDPDVVSELDTLHDRLRSQALDANDSLTLLAELADHSQKR